MHAHNVDKFFLDLYFECGAEKWKVFQNKVKDKAAYEDSHKLIDLQTFENLVEEYLDKKLSDDDRSLLFNTSGRINNGVKQINIS